MAKRKKPLVTKDGDRQLDLPPKPMRRGSLSERFTKCSKPRCRCAVSRDGRHGPYYSLTRRVDGRTKSRWLSQAQADVVRQQLEEGDRFRQDVESYWEACEELADVELGHAEATSAEEVEKGGFRGQSKPRSRQSSRSS